MGIIGGPPKQKHYREKDSFYGFLALTKEMSREEMFVKLNSIKFSVETNIDVYKGYNLNDLFKKLGQWNQCSSRTYSAMITKNWMVCQKMLKAEQCIRCFMPFATVYERKLHEINHKSDKCNGKDTTSLGRLECEDINSTIGKINLIFSNLKLVEADDLNSML